MRPRFLLILLLILIVPVAIGGVWWFSPNQVVKRKTIQLLDIISLAADQGVAPRQLRNMKLEKLLAKQINLEVGSEAEIDGSYSRTDMLSLYAALCNATKTSEFKLARIDALQADTQRAEMQVVIQAKVVLSNKDKPFDGLYPTLIVWQKGEDGWQLTDVRVSEAQAQTPAVSEDQG